MSLPMPELDGAEPMEHMQSIFRRFIPRTETDMEESHLTAGVGSGVMASLTTWWQAQSEEDDGEEEDHHLHGDLSRLDDMLLEAAAHGDASAVQRLWQAGADINIAGDHGKTPLYLASELNHVDMTKELLLIPQCDMRKSDLNARTPLHAAAQQGHIEVVNSILRANLSRSATGMQIAHNNTDSIADMKDVDRRTPLHLAAETNQARVIEHMLAYKADPDKRDLIGATPLILAATLGHLATVEALTGGGCDLDERNIEGRTALMEATAQGHQEVVRHLIQGGCHVNVMDCHGYTALSEAACGNDVHLVDMLLTGGADADEQDSRGRTALHIAILHGRNEVADLLIQADCQINTQDQDGYTPLFLAAWDPWERGTNPVLHTLATRANLDICDAEGVAPIVKAWPNKEHVITLIENGCNVTVTTTNGLTLLELAALEGDFPLVRMMMAAGFDRKAIDFTKRRMKYQSEYAKLAEICLSPISLKDSCRLAIRENIHKPILQTIPALPIPPLLKRFVAFKVML